MRQILPDIISDNYLAGNFSGTFIASGLFLDISGFSSMTDALMQHGQHGAEILSQIMRKVFDPVVDQILAQGGTIVGFAGDAVTAIFKDEGDTILSLRLAISAAVGLQNEIANLVSIETVYGNFPITARIGLAYGLVNWGILLSADKSRASYYFNGEAIVDSALAEHQAYAGEIVISPFFHSHLQDEISSAPRDGFFLLTEANFTFPAPRPFNLKEPDISILRIFFPDILLKTNVPNEFRQVINLFIQLPDQPASSLADFMQDLFEMQIRFGGLISRIDYGDKGCNILLFWGAPIALENDILRALNFIYSLQALGKHNLKAGVTYYVSCAGFMGGSRREEYTCYGRGVNLAARFMTGASYGEVWVDERTYTRAQRHFDLEVIGDFSFKGFAQKQKVFTLKKPKASSVATYQRSMVGREKELSLMEEFVKPLWRGTFVGGMIIWGDAGIGKSRLVDEFRSSAFFQDNPAFWAFCPSNQFVRQSFDPFRYWLKNYFDISTTQNDQENLGRFHAKLQKLISSLVDEDLKSELIRTTSFLAELVDLSIPNSLYDRLDAQGRYDNTFIGLSFLIRAESLVHPLVLIFEDSQYIDQDSLAFLSYLKRVITADERHFPIAIFATARRDPSTPTFDPSIFEREIYLDTISKDGIQTLAEEILNGTISIPLLGLLVERSEGNPFFAEQILTYLNEENLLQIANGEWHLISLAPDSSLPVDIHAILVARLDQLTREVRDVIQTASILGREFEVSVLSCMIQDGYDLQRSLDEAEKAAIWSLLTEIRYLFKHALLRDAAYTMQMQAQREKLHALAVEAFESLYPETLESHYAELAYHAERANLVQKARLYLRLAGDAARKAYQNTLAADYYTRALALTPETEQKTRFDILLSRERVYAFQGQLVQQVKDLNTLRAIATGLDDAMQAEVGLRELKHLYFSGNFSQVEEKVKPVLSLAMSVGKFDIVNQAYIYWIFSLQRQGHYADSIRKTRIALSLARKSGDLEAEAKLLNSFGLVLLELKRLKHAERYFVASLAISEKTNSLSTTARVLNNLAMLAGFHNDFKTAQEYYAKSWSLSREIGDRKGESIILTNLGWINGILGEFPQAYEFAQRTLQISHETGDRFTEAYSHINLCAQSGARGDFENATTHALKGLEITKLIGDRSGEAWALTYLGHNYLATGRLDQAVESYRTAIALRTQLNQNVLATEPATGLARAQLLHGDSSQALATISTVLDHINNGGKFEGTDEPVRIYASCYYVLKALNHPDAVTILDAGMNSLRDRLSHIPDETARTRFINDIVYNHELMSAWQNVHTQAF